MTGSPRRREARRVYGTDASTGFLGGLTRGAQHEQEDFSGMMFLFNGIRAEVETVRKKNGWYRLTGKQIERWTAEVGDTFSDLTSGRTRVDYRAIVLGLHDPDLEQSVPRFNHENGAENGNAIFGVCIEGRSTYMLMGVNRAEYVICRFWCPHAAGQDEEYDPMSHYRVEVPSSKGSGTKKAVA